uniref:Uncharacterized protein n=1 Tax=Rhizophora mucronata TaxID=61149 RepID=A0A2P2P930_RHIMU
MAEILKKQAELEKYSEEILGTADVLKMQWRVFKVGSCFLVQLMLLILVFWLLMMQLAPRSGVIVPT